MTTYPTTPEAQDAPKHIWATGNRRCGSWNNEPARYADHQVHYVRADAFDAAHAEIAKLRGAVSEMQAIARRGIDHGMSLACCYKIEAKAKAALAPTGVRDGDAG